MTLDSRRCAAGQLLTTLSLSLLGTLRLELGVLLRRRFSGFASLDLGRFLGALALQAVGSDQTLDLGSLMASVRNAGMREEEEIILRALERFFLPLALRSITRRTVYLRTSSTCLFTPAAFSFLVTPGRGS